MSSIKTPNAAVIIWNYEQRLSEKDADESTINKISEVVLNTVSLISIKTSKDKSEPSGTFQFTLAPLKNWVSFLSPGSWCAIMMTQDKMGPNIKKDSYVAKENELKMIGRINSVRVAVRVDEDGARSSIYIVEGEDWGNIFKSVMYIDPAFRQSTDSAVGTAEALTYGDSVRQLLSGKFDSQTTTQNMNTLINLWGDQNGVLANISSIVPISNIGSVKASFVLPNKMVRFLSESTPSLSGIVKNNMKNATGVLDGYDKYKETKESVGIIHVDDVVGTHTMWDILKKHSNEIVNELVTDIRWVDGKPKLTLWKRVRPFLTTEPSGGQLLEGVQVFGIGDDFSAVGTLVNARLSNDILPQVSSQFKDVYRTEIPLEDVISIDAGTNWRDKINFIEILPAERNFTFKGQSYNLSTAVKSESQQFDRVAFSREGMKGLSLKTNFFPLKQDGTPDFLNYTFWKEILSKWYFNNHNFLNGTVEFMGQSKHIPVGSNIMIDAIVLGPSQNMSSKHLKRRKKTYLLLHVNNVAHSFFTDKDGRRHYRTTIQFTRGVLADSNGKPISTVAIDRDTSSMTPKDERNKANTITTSAAADPDFQKVRGT